MSNAREPTIREDHMAVSLAAQAIAIKRHVLDRHGRLLDHKDALALAATIMAGRLAGGEDSV